MVQQLRRRGWVEQQSRLHLDHERRFDDEVGAVKPYRNAAVHDLERHLRRDVQAAIGELYGRSTLIDTLDEAISELRIHVQECPNGQSGE